MPKIHLLVDNIINSKKRNGEKISYIGIQTALKKNGGESVGLNFNDVTTFNTKYLPHIKTSTAFILWQNKEKKDKEKSSDEVSSDEEGRKGELKPSSLEMVNMDNFGRGGHRKSKRRKTRRKSKRRRKRRTRRR